MTATGAPPDRHRRRHRRGPGRGRRRGAGLLVGPVPSVRLTILALLALLAVPACLRPVSAATSDVVGAAGDEHLWLAVPVRGDDALVELLHHALVDEPGDVHRVAVLPGAPAALAAWGDRVWLVHASRRAGGEREVYTAAIRPHPLGGSWMLVPADQLDVAPPLPGRGRLAGVVGTARGPVALLVPDDPADDAPAELLALRASGWTGMPLPSGLAPSPGGECRLIAAGPTGLLLTILADDPKSGIAQFVRGPDGAWTSRALPAARGMRSVQRVGGQVVGLRGQDDGSLDVVLIRPGTVLPVARVPSPAPPGAVLGLGDGLRVFARLGGEQATVRRVTVPGGTVEDVVAIVPKRPDALRVLRTPTLIAILVFVIIFIVLLRMPGRAEIELPAGVVPAAPTTRLAALAIDLVPGGVLAVVLTGVSPAALLLPPFFVPDALAAVPWSIMVTVGTVIGAIGELVRGRTPGKALLGLRVVDQTGGRPSLRSLFARNGMKLLVLLLPPLAIVVVLDPNGQGLHDSAGRTVVVRDEDAGTPGS